MQAIVNPVSALSLFGAPLLLPLAAWLHRRGPARRFRLLALADTVYLVERFGVSVTVAANIPLNEELAAFPVVTAPAAQAASVRVRFAPTWNQWHAVRWWGWGWPWPPAWHRQSRKSKQNLLSNVSIFSSCNRRSVYLQLVPP